MAWLSVEIYGLFYKVKKTLFLNLVGYQKNSKDAKDVLIFFSPALMFF